MIQLSSNIAALPYMFIFPEICVQIKIQSVLYVDCTQVLKITGQANQSITGRPLLYKYTCILTLMFWSVSGKVPKIVSLDVPTLYTHGHSHPLMSANLPLDGPAIEFHDKIISIISALLCRCCHVVHLNLVLIDVLLQNYACVYGIPRVSN